MNQIWKLVASAMLMLYWISLNLPPLKGRCTTDSLPKRSFQNSLDFLLEFWVLLTNFLRDILEDSSLKSVVMNILF